MLATLLLWLGVPMLLGGDELGRSQAGNNNGYCQDGPVSWYDWTAVDPELLAFTRRLLSLRRADPHSGGGGSCEVPDPARSTGSLLLVSR